MIEISPREGEPLKLTRIRCYPLKGAGGFDLPATRFDVFGVPGDRRWMLVKENGDFISQRTHPSLALIQLSPSGEGAHPPGQGSKIEPREVRRFVAEAPGMDPIFLDLEAASGPTIPVRVQQDRVEAVLIESVSNWFSAYFGEECRLVFSPERFNRPVDPDYAPGHTTSFSDGYPLLITTEASLTDLNQRLAQPSSMLRFRPNLVVGGAEPWEEDGWRILEVGGVRLELVKPCARCSVTTVDPGTGTRGKEPLKTLSGFRRWEGKAYFGQNAIFSGTSSFRVGQNVRILERGEARPPLARDPSLGQA